MNWNKVFDNWYESFNNGEWFMIRFIRGKWELTWAKWFELEWKYIGRDIGQFNTFEEAQNKAIYGLYSL